MALIFFVGQKTAYGMRMSDWNSDVCSSDLVGNGKGIDPLQAADVVSVLLRVGPAPMMGVDATGAAEVVLGSIGVELVEPEMLRTSHDAKPGQRHRRDD